MTIQSPKIKPHAVILTSHPAVYQQILAFLHSVKEEEHPQGTIYDVGFFSTDNGELQVALVEINLGNNQAAMETERAINYFNPKIVFFAGLAVGIKNLKTGDVVISTKIYGYESGKVIPETFQPSPSVGNPSYRLEQRARAIARREDWLDKIDPVPFPKPIVHLGALAAGEKEILSSESDIIRLLQTHYSDALAIEMEGRGFLESVRANENINAIVVRGISRLLDENEHADVGEIEKTSAKHAVAFVFEMLAKSNLIGTAALRTPTGFEKTGETAALTTRADDRNAKAGSLRSNKISDVHTKTLENLYSVLTGSPSPIVWVGGGSSVKSGIPLSDGLVEKAVRWQHCRDNNLSFDDPRVIYRLSDWMPEFRKQSWFQEGDLADNFPKAMHYLLRPHDNRRGFFRHIVDTNVPASSGYKHLTEFMALGFVMTVLTTNFDRVLVDLCRSSRRPHHVDIIDNQSSKKYLSTSPTYPLITYVYGSISDYVDRFDKDERQPVESELAKRLIPILRDHPLIVIGYRGAEEEIINDLLLKHLESVDYFRQGIYWCVQNYKSIDELHPLVQDLARAVGGNFQIVTIEGFEEMMEQLWTLQQRHQKRSISPLITEPLKNESGVAAGAPTFDLNTVEADIHKELDWINMKTRLENYYAVWSMPLPDKTDQQWLEEELCRQHLASLVGGKVLPTKAGYLLFGRKPAQRIAASLIKLRVNGEEQEIEGSLWNQLSLIMDALAEVNKSFLLKGEKSETVYPYPATALREIVVNALVHRDYELTGNTIIEIEDDRIVITNPGGLIKDVFLQTEGGAILNQIEQGVRGIKGYRNPVIADFFYSSHDMEKKGSGLADVHQLVRENGGKVTFGPINDNTAFQVVIYSRPEAVNRQTNTAAVVVSTRYAANLLEIELLPPQIWQAPTPYNRPRDLWSQADSVWLPPFIINNKKIYTFFDLEEKNNPLREFVDVFEVTREPVNEFAQDEDNKSKLVWLLNECLYKHMAHCGLIVDKSRRRAYFSGYRASGEKRQVSYQARLRKSTRTVTKPVISPTTEKIRYWEHQSFNFGLERFVDTWALHILPGYVFTLDGIRDLLSGERVNVLSTKRASRDYNSKVHTDLIFWLWVLSGGNQGSFDLMMGPTPYENSKFQEILATVKNKRISSIKNNLSYYGMAANQPQITLRAALPTFTIHSLEEGSEDEVSDKQQLAELAELEEEMSALLEEIEDRVEGNY